MLELCPCGSSQAYAECCGRFIEGTEFPVTPEQLMRSRYVAYSQANISYIIKTMRGPAAQGFDPEQARQWALRVSWLGLRVITSGTLGKDKGLVEFMARYREAAGNHYIHEVSEFHYCQGRWYYVTGTTPKTGRNALCPCGSGKKFKHCCAA